MEAYLLENSAPEDVHDFLLQHWARLMTSIFLAKGNQDPDWTSGWDTVNSLVWSLSPKQDRQETEKMLRMLPAILARMHEGCAALALPVPEQNAFFERLALLHAAVARDGLKFKADNESNLTRLAEAEETDARAEVAELVSSADAGPGLPSNRNREPEGEMPDIAVGDHVQFTLAGESRVLRLNWVSPVGGMYLFANDQGLDALTLTRARLAERFQAGTARRV